MASFAGGKIYSSVAGQEITTAAWTQVTLGGTSFDSDVFASTAANELTVATTGLHGIIGSLGFEENHDAVDTLIAIRVNGTEERRIRFQNGVAHWPCRQIFVMLDLTAGDDVQLWVYQSSGSNATIWDAEAVTSLSLWEIPQQTFEGARIYLDAAQSVSTGTMTKMQLGGETFDVGGWSDIANDQVEAQKTGIALINAQVAFEYGIDDKEVRAELRVDTAALQLARASFEIGHWTVFNVSGLVEVTALDAIEFYVYQNDGFARNAFDGGNAGMGMQVQYMGTI